MEKWRTKARRGKYKLATVVAAAALIAAAASGCSSASSQSSTAKLANAGTASVDSTHGTICLLWPNETTLDLEGERWQRIVSLNYFDGGSRMLGSLESECELRDDFISAGEILVTGCESNGGDKLVAMNTDGKVLWIDATPPVAIWPEVVMAQNGKRIARETLGVTHAINAYASLDPEDIKGQWVTVYDAATGDMALETQASPVLDAGGNVAISPSGRRVAVVNAGAIQVFDLPEPPTLPVTVGVK